MGINGGSVRWHSRHGINHIAVNQHIEVERAGLGERALIIKLDLGAAVGEEWGCQRTAGPHCRGLAAEAQVPPSLGERPHAPIRVGRNARRVGAVIVGHAIEGFHELLHPAAGG